MNSKQKDNAHPAGSSPAEAFGELQQLVNTVFAKSEHVSRMDLIVRADIDDLCDDLKEVIGLLPAGTYKRQRLCDQLNSILTAHGWAYVYGTVE